jgi:hypothetical protein
MRDAMEIARKSGVSYFPPDPLGLIFEVYKNNPRGLQIRLDEFFYPTKEKEEEIKGKIIENYKKQ